MASRPPGGRIVQRGRAKAFRPLPEEERRLALRGGLDAYARGDYFLAHELLEPAWMGSPDPVERDLHQGLIKLAAAFVHAVRGNAEGQRKNLAGARALLAGDGVASFAGRLDTSLVVDVGAVVAAIDERLGRLGAHPRAPDLDPVRLRPPDVPADPDSSEPAP